MKRTLSLVLDEECKVSLTLMEDEISVIDEFTTKFENSEEIRNYFQTQINDFLEKNKDFIEYVKKQTGKNYRGGIVLLNTLEKNNTELIIDREMVLYKKHLVIYPKLIKQDIMKEYLNEDKKRAARFNVPAFTTNYMYYRIKDNNFDTKKNIGEILYFIKSSNFYEKIRLIFKAYEKIRKIKNYCSVDAIYKKILQEKEDKVKEEQEALKEFYQNKTPDFRDKYKGLTPKELINSEDDYGISR